MTTLVITPKTTTERKMVEKLMHSLGIGIRSLTDEEKEDMGLALLLKQADRTKKVSRDSVMKKLK